jgi:hypothetical protein
MGAFAGLLIGAWIFYMVFDAWTTAKARRDGLPIPDPIGLNAILEGREGGFRERVEQAGERLGTHVEYAAQNIGQHWRKAGAAAPPGTGANVAAGDAGSSANPSAGPSGADPSNAGPSNTEAGSGRQAANPGGPPPPAGGYYYPGAEGAYPGAPYPGGRREQEHSPMGAVVLIGLGVLFLLANLGWFSFQWISHFWPVILIVIGVWLFIQRQRQGR